MAILSPFYTSVRRPRRRAENRRIHRRHPRALHKTSEVPIGLGVGIGPARGTAERRRPSPGRRLLSEVAEALVLADPIVGQLLSLAAQAADGVPDMEEPFGDGLASLVAMTEAGSSRAKGLLGRTGEPVPPAQGLFVSLAGLTSSALGLSDLSLSSPAAAGAALVRLTAARGKILAQLEEVDRADEAMEAMEEERFSKGMARDRLEHPPQPGLDQQGVIPILPIP